MADRDVSQREGDRRKPVQERNLAETPVAERGDIREDDRNRDEVDGGQEPCGDELESRREPVRKLRANPRTDQPYVDRRERTHLTHPARRASGSPP
jgi:hypothetical protein